MSGSAWAGLRFALKMMTFVFKMMNFSLKMMDFVFKMMDLMQTLRRPKACPTTRGAKNSIKNDEFFI